MAVIAAGIGITAAGGKGKFGRFTLQ
jgi:hypothetical protein